MSEALQTAYDRYTLQIIACIAILAFFAVKWSYEALRSLVRRIA